MHTDACKRTLGTWKSKKELAWGLLNYGNIEKLHFSFENARKIYSKPLWLKNRHNRPITCLPRDQHVIQRKNHTWLTRKHIDWHTEVSLQLDLKKLPKKKSLHPIFPCSCYLFTGCGHLHHLCCVSAVRLHAVPALPRSSFTTPSKFIPTTHQRGGEYGNYVHWLGFLINLCSTSSHILIVKRSSKKRGCKVCLQSFFFFFFLFL